MDPWGLCCMRLSIVPWRPGAAGLTDSARASEIRLERQRFGWSIRDSAGASEIRLERQRFGSSVRGSASATQCRPESVGSAACGPCGFGALACLDQRMCQMSEGSKSRVNFSCQPDYFECSFKPASGRRFIEPGEMKTEYPIMIGGANFGCGSSREHAPVAMGASGAAATKLQCPV